MQARGGACVLQRAPPGYWGSLLVSVVQTGFCGALTTVSTYVTEASARCASCLPACCLPAALVASHPTLPSPALPSPARPSLTHHPTRPPTIHPRTHHPSALPPPTTLPACMLAGRWSSLAMRYPSSCMPTPMAQGRWRAARCLGWWCMAGRCGRPDLPAGGRVCGWAAVGAMVTLGRAASPPRRCSLRPLLLCKPPRCAPRCAPRCQGSRPPPSLPPPHAHAPWCCPLASPTCFIEIQLAWHSASTSTQHMQGVRWGRAPCTRQN